MTEKPNNVPWENYICSKIGNLQFEISPKMVDQEVNIRTIHLDIPIIVV